MSVGSTYLTHPALAQLPTLIRKQRRLEAIVAAVAQDEIDEKAVRAEIDALLRAAGIQAGDSVSCAGYDVTHHAQRGAPRSTPTSSSSSSWAPASIAHSSSSS